MLRIAFVDHHLNNYHADTFLGLLRRGALDGAAQVVAAWESDPTGDDWCEKQGIPRAGSIAEAVQAADAVLVLAPDNIDAHPSLAAAVLPAGKPVFFDKMLAPTPELARGIVAEARRNGTPLFSASALRFAVELDGIKEPLGGRPADEAAARGLGRWDHYGVHTLSLAFALMGQGVQRIIDTGTPTARTVTLDYGGGRRALVDCRAAANEWEVFGWSFAARPAGADRYVGATVTDYSGFYANLLRETLAFFQTGKAPIPAEGLLESVAVLTAADRSLARQGEWVPVDL